MPAPVLTLILYVDDPSALPRSLAALEQWEGFSAQARLIVADPAPGDEAGDLCALRANARYLPLPGAELAQAVQTALEQAEGEYVCFAPATASYTPDFFPAALEGLAGCDAPFASANPVYAPTGAPYAASADWSRERRVISLEEEPRQLPLCPCACLFRRSLLCGLDCSLHDEALTLALLELLLERPRYLLLEEGVQYRYTAALEDDATLSPLPYADWWYTPSLERGLLPLLERAEAAQGSIPTFLQAAACYLLYQKCSSNLNERSRQVLEGEEQVEGFWRSAGAVLTHVAPEVIFHAELTPHCSAKRSLRMQFLRRRAAAMGDRWRIDARNGRFTALLSGPDGQEREVPLSRLNRERLRIQVINFTGSALVIDAVCGISDFLPPEQCELEAVVWQGREKQRRHIPARRTGIYPLVKCFGVTFQRRCPVQFVLPVTGRENIRFCFRLGGEEYPLALSFSGGHSRLNEADEHAYWCLAPGRVLYREGSTLHLRPMGLRGRLRRERDYRRSIAANVQDEALRRRILRVRRLYWLLLPLVRRRHIWVCFDKVYKAGDNGEYLYQYLRTHPRGVEPYYIIRPDAPDCQRLLAQDKKHVLLYGSVRCQVLSLLAEIFLATHANVSAQYSDSLAYRPWLRDLQRGSVVCVQHGLTVHDFSQYQNRTFDNTRLYCCASRYEVENLLHPYYDYAPEELKLTGLARYDGLVNRDERILLITPSWRKNVVFSSTVRQKSDYNPNFRHSAYFRLYNRLINDPRLLQCARACGYRIVYLLHPVVSPQAEDFTPGEGVELLPSTGSMSYEEIFCKSSLMVTDYSGVQFDFAYQRKPVVYYHPPELPPSYAEGTMDYQSMGFGPVCTGHEQLVDTLCAAMEQGCVNPAEYRRRADDFFAFDDHNNCQRIVDAVLQWQAACQAEASVRK